MRNESFAIKTLTAATMLALSGTVQGAEQDPYLMADDTWISLSGTVTSVAADAFRLDYGGGMITVEMDDWGDAFSLVGDESLYVEDTIEAASVYVEELNSFFYGRAADEEGLGVWAVDTVVTIGNVNYVGTVESVDDDCFTIDTGEQQLTVEVDALPYDPLDDESFQKIESGDVVSAEGTLDSISSPTTT